MVALKCLNSQRLINFSLAFTLFLISIFAISSTQCCVLENENHIYDFSPLAERDYWLYEEKSRYDGFNLAFYLSVCHPLRNLPNGDHCSEYNGSAVCIEHMNRNYSLSFQQRFEKVVVPNAGTVDPSKILDSFTITHGGWLEYKYDTGMKCDSLGKNMNYKTTLNLLCPGVGSVRSDETFETDGPILMSFSDCELVFAWLTKAACAIENKVNKVTTCQDKFYDSNDTLNLHALHISNYYNVSSSTNYEINICGPIKNGSCNDTNATVCDVTNPSDPKVISTTNDMDVMWHGPIFTLHYNHNTTKSSLPSGQKEVVMQFQCDRSALDSKISYVVSNSTHVIFSTKSHAVCTPKPQQCVIRDRKGNVYDLRPLHKNQDNWQVLDNREDHRDVLYHINICKPLVDVGYFACPLGNTGACQTSMNRQTALSLGLLSSDPIVNEDGTITVLYTGGDPCKNKQHTRSTRMTLICDDHEHEPEFLDETTTCEYVFQWRTSMACPRHVVTSNNCTVTDPLFGHTFDIRSLRNNLSDYSTSDGTHTFYLNPCGPLVGNQYYGLSSGSSVAMSEDKNPNYYSGGKYPGKLIFNDGILIQELEGGSICKLNETYSTQIMYMCDHNATDAFTGLTVYRHYSSCKLNFLWRTKYACPPHSVVDCSVTTKKGLKYDLNPLSLTNINQEEYGSNNQVKYVLNVCRSVVHGKVSRCAYDSASCLVDMSNKNLSVNLGKVNSGPYLENGLLKLKYPEGDICNATHKYTTEIIFECDPEEMFPYPRFIAKENCKYVFEWKTAHACPEKIPVTSIFGNCSVKNTFTNYLYDLSSLSKATGYIINKGNTILKINVCGQVTSCPNANDGACSSDASGVFTSAGNANDDVSFTPGTLTLKYEGGSKCNNGVSRTTFISFFCGAEHSIEGPVLVSIDDTSCTYFVNWHTELACDFRVVCASKSFHGTTDLSPLIKHFGNYEVAMPNTHNKFYINVCRPVNHMKDVHCEAGSSICLVHPDASPPFAESLGKPLLRPNPYNSDKSIMILYPLGDECASVPGMKYSSRITFICDRSAGKGYPIYSEFTHDCQYKFTWRTSLVCPKDAPIGDTTCAVKHNKAKTNVQLSPLYRPNGYRVPFGSQVFYINICGSVCNQSGVCTDTDVSYGHTAQSLFKWRGNHLELIYFGGDSCHSALAGKRTASIYFICDMSAGYGYPEADPIMGDIDCMATFKWRTNITCMDAIYVTSTTTIKPTTIIIKPTTTTIKPTTIIIPTNNSSQPIHFSTTTSTTPLPTNGSVIDPNTQQKHGSDDPNKSTGSYHAVTMAIIVLVIVVIAMCTVYFYRAGYVKRFYNRMKMATILPQHYSSRHGGVLLNDDFSS